MVVFIQRNFYTLCSCGWCAEECNYALFDGKSSVHVMGAFCVLFGIIQMWAGGVAYSVSSSQSDAAGAWWSGMMVFLTGIFAFIRTFQCCKSFKCISIVLR